ncbi:L-glutamate gamma-semialdehyde dehydrogenase [Kitasatospora aureofaciens]|uniref:L-glutamate gamma-semialdehyde dehydrogenase n=1 Tax=Kitasatospora aureofaciens TaxID=1894 RepID=A0A1E7MW99_KITAU|nr:L-glutamate gamma-semialdehyde dehydrogenase [Kitasatospora aureofaciens]QEU99462.1 L-glutamate gamma-semialdehyde dehydrogenase [Streptomyces viridifaciens]ARF78248.1 1-pyrroline-5-carboxylate dehydrogenase [Kitasatospora aureofaciens]OEV32712.1 1-pyrroline-5-carboxylate dehydrogenase [Kitasatospora aureofaciens]UKZ05549.1 L-glutamate gamma-semialdehyde dehydrogenase [Streptomyces viridifaciens]GGU80638.1 1-pyrroline-5-carboxylate dehydrogenase [Kitasatospora aureofaciens]
MDAVTQVPAPVNEPVHSYAPGSPERARLEAKLKELGGQEPVQLTMTINGERRMGGGTEIHVVQPHNHAARLGTLRNATQADAQDAIDAALAAAPAWQALSFDSRAAIFLKAADLLAGPWRETLAAATMLGQSKTAQQAEIDTPCELVDFLRFNVHFARQIMAEQPISSDGVWNRSDHRPLEGFVYAITPFNFTAIAGNLPTAPALMGNVVLWKPSPTQQYSAHLLMQLLEEAGLPKGVINMVTGDGLDVSAVALKHPALAGIHFTGSTATFQHLWREVGNNIAGYRTYPRIVGETGGKDFLVAHPSADPAVLKTAMTRGAFEFQGQKCSALSRAYVPASLWAGLKDEFAAEVEGLTMGDVTDLSNFMSAVIDERAFAKNKAAIDRAQADDTVEVLAGGTYDDSVGYFVRPTVLVCQDPASEYFRDEYFGPILAVYVYEDEKYEEMLAQMESVSAYGLTGSIISQDRAAAQDAMHKLRFAAGNFYINDKPTGAVVGQQPFGGGRASGTNDKAGAKQNLARWTSTRSIKETFVPPTDYRYPHMG